MHAHMASPVMSRRSFRCHPSSQKRDRSCLRRLSNSPCRPEVDRSLQVCLAAENDKAGPPARNPPLGVDLDQRISSGEFSDTGSTKEQLTRPLRQFIAKTMGRPFAYQLARLGWSWRRQAAEKMPVARGDVREIVGQPVFVPLFKLFLRYGTIFKLSFGPKTFVIVSDPAVAKQILVTNAERYSKGILSEILEFVMGNGLIPADGEIWKARRRALVPSLHRKYVASMVDMFGDCALHGCETIDKTIAAKKPLEMENFFSRLALDIIGKAVFNYNFDSLTNDDPVIKAVYVALREAEYRSMTFVPYWNIPGAMYVVPRQRKCLEALKVVNETLDSLVAKCKKLTEEEDMEFTDEFLSERDPSILHFLLASGDQISSKQLRDDLMTLLIAGHETTAAVLTWTFHLLVQHPDVVARVRAEVDSVLGDRKPGVEDFRALRFTTRVVSESMRLYPQPPVLIRRTLEADTFDKYPVPAGTDIFISVWNLHHSPALWQDPEEFNPDRFPLDGPVPNEITENFAYLPFGAGRRKCIGDQFALFETLTALAMLVRRYDFEMAPNAPAVGMTTGATIHTVNGLWMSLRPRAIPPPQQPMHGWDGAAVLANGQANGNGNGNGKAEGVQPNGNGSGAHVNGNGAHVNGSSAHAEAAELAAPVAEKKMAGV